MQRKVKAWALIDRGKITYYVHGSLSVFYNKPFSQRSKVFIRENVVPCIITYKDKTRLAKRK